MDVTSTLDAVPSRASGLVPYKNALIVPAPRGKTRINVLPIAVLDSAGERIEDAACDTNALSSTAFIPGAEHRVIEDELPGRWLFGGIATRHFGHQITRMMGRLPWLDHAGEIDGIVFAGFRKNSAHREERELQQKLFDLFGIEVPFHTVLKQTQVEELLVGPDQFSEALKCRATPDFRAWARRSVGLDDIPIQKGRKVYVTRTRLDPGYGRILCEDVLENNLVENGYEVFAPEEHDLKTQFETYASAETLVMSDGSPGHVSAFALRDGQTQAVIARRLDWPLYLMNHFKSFAKDGGKVEHINHVKEQVWTPKRSSNTALAEVDFDALKSDLQACGALEDGSISWRAPSQNELSAAKRQELDDGKALVSDADREAFLLSMRLSRRRMKMLHELDAMKPALPAIRGLRYFRVLNRLHAIMQPKWYLEVGTFTGRSLTLARGNYIAVDPNFRIEYPIVNAGADRMHLFQETSDDFFASRFLEKNEITVEMAFLDGLHHFEVLLRDFINTEKHMSRDGIVILHDCCPTNHAMTSRVQGEGAWTGDVWKTLLILKRHRPDLTFRVLDAAPTGLVVISGLDPENRVLDEAHDTLVAEYQDLSFADMPSGLESYYAEFDIIPALDGLESLRIARSGEL